MKHKEIEKRVRYILSESLDIPLGQIKLSTLLVDELGLDSYGILEITQEIEEAFDIKLIKESAVFPKLVTVKDAADYVYKSMRNISK